MRFKLQTENVWCVRMSDAHKADKNCLISSVNIIVYEIIKYRFRCLILLPFKCKELNEVNMLLNYVMHVEKVII